MGGSAFVNEWQRPHAPGAVARHAPGTYMPAPVLPRLPAVAPAPPAAPPPLPAATANAVAGSTAAQGGTGGGSTGQDSVYPNFSVPTERGNVDGLLGRTRSFAAAGLPRMPTLNDIPGASPTEDASRGLFAPELEGQLSSMMDEATPLLRSTGIVDRLRGRQAMRMRQRLIEGAVAQAGAKTNAFNATTGRMGADASMLGARSSALRAANEVPLAMLQAGVQQRGQDMTYDEAARRTDMTGAVAKMHDATQRYGIDESAATQRQASEYGLAHYLPDIAHKTRVNDLMQAGRMDDAERAARVYSPATGGGGKVTTDVLPNGQIAITDAQGNVRFYDPKVEAEKQALAERDAKREARVSQGK